MSELLERFAEVDVTGYPDIHLFDDELDVVLWILLVANEKLGFEAMTVSEIGDVSTRVYRRGLTRQRASALLVDARLYVARSGRAVPARYMLLRPGQERLRGKTNAVTIVDPANSFTALTKLDELLATVDGEVRLCDPYVDDKTLVVLASVPRINTISLLTQHVSDQSSFRRKLQAYDREYGNLELRVDATSTLHDRYLLDASQMWLFGQSLNGIGKKQSFIVRLGPDVRVATLRAFEQRWNSASRWR